ncbi:hypothetical protein ABMB67_000377 [Halalkalibacter oceani]
MGSSGLFIRPTISPKIYSVEKGVEIIGKVSYISN